MQVSKKTGGNGREKEISHYTDQRVVELIHRKEIALNTLELTFKKPDGFEYNPGQYAIVSLNKPEYTELDMSLRSLSMASHPDEDDLKFIMRKSDSSFKKSCLSMKAGDTATIYGPTGDFALKGRKNGMVFLASGIGITPVIPFLKELEKNRYTNPVFLFSSNRTEREAACHQTIQEIRIKGLQYIPVITTKQGRINSELIKNTLGDPAEFEYYVIGSNSFIGSMTESLELLGIPGEDIHLDDFG
jgi:ferredoxin-NADP reductase